MAAIQNTDDIYTWYVLSKNSAENYCRMCQTENSIIISINDDYHGAKQEYAYLPMNKDNRVVAVLPLVFDDVEEDEAAEGGKYEGYTVISDEQAERIANFVLAYKDRCTRIICHCYAGVSRSAGCCAAIMKALTGDDSRVFDSNMFCPNMTVYRKVLNAFANKGIFD